MMQISILGAGSWGSAIAIAMSRVGAIKIWSRNPQQVLQINTAHTNLGYLPNEILFAHNVSATTNLSEILDTDLLIIATPVNALKEILDNISIHDKYCGVDLIWLCKGFSIDSAYLPHQIVQQVYPNKTNMGAILGPSFAAEVAKSLPTAVTLASLNETFSKKWLEIFRAIPNFRVYASHDLIGAEIGAGVKNIIAIAAGIADGLNLGYNARAALITRSISELTKLVVSLGGKIETLYGLSGVGDLILTCTGDLSRNRQVGLELAQGRKIADITSRIQHVAEGVYATKAVFNLAKRLNIPMPVVEAVYSIIYEDANIGEVLTRLLNRSLKFE